MTMRRTELLTEALERFREVHLKVFKDRHRERIEEQTIEECGELIAAIMQTKRRDRGERKANLRKELVDVFISLHCMVMLEFGEEDFFWDLDRVTTYVIERLEELSESKCQTERQTRQKLLELLTPRPKQTGEEYRAAGGCLCECGHPYRLHPRDVYHDYLNVLCNGDRVKL